MVGMGGICEADGIGDACGIGAISIVDGTDGTDGTDGMGGTCGTDGTDGICVVTDARVAVGMG